MKEKKNYHVPVKSQKESIKEVVGGKYFKPVKKNFNYLVMMSVK